MHKIKTQFTVIFAIIFWGLSPHHAGAIMLPLQELPPALQPPSLVHSTVMTEDDVMSAGALMHAVKAVKRWFDDQPSGARLVARTALVPEGALLALDMEDGYSTVHVPDDAIMTGELAGELPAYSELSSEDMYVLFQGAVDRAVMLTTERAGEKSMAGLHLLRLVADVYAGKMSGHLVGQIDSYAQGTIEYYLGEAHPALDVWTEYSRRLMLNSPKD